METQYTLFPPLVPAATTTTTTTQKPVWTVAFDAHGLTWNTTDGWSIALLILTTVRLMLTLCLWTYLTYGTVRARTRLALIWPHQLLLAILTLSHGVLYGFALLPTARVCGALRLCLGLVYVTMFGVLLLKLIVIAANDKGYEVPRNGQILLLVLVMSVQFGLSVQWVILIPSDVVKEPQRICDTSVSEWLGHLSYVGILLVAATVLALAIHDVKTDRRESMFLGLAVGLNVPVLSAFSLAAGLRSDVGGGDVEKLLAFGLLASTTVVLFVMFLPRSRQLSAMGESGLYNEDVAVVKPMSELTVHKLYYPVYEDQQRRSSGSSMTASRRTTDFAFTNDDLANDYIAGHGRSDSPANEVETVSTTHHPSRHHWYPPLRTNNVGSSMRGREPVRHYQYPSPNHLDHYTGIRRVRLVGVQELPSSSRCLTPPSEEEEEDEEEEGSTTPSAQGDSEEANSEMDIADFHEHNVNGVSYTSVHINKPRQPVY